MRQSTRRVEKWSAALGLCLMIACGSNRSAESGKATFCVGTGIEQPGKRLNILGGSTAGSLSGIDDVTLTAFGLMVAPTTECTGVVVANDWVLTAEHCVRGSTADSLLFYSLALDGSAKANAVSAVVVHPQSGIDVALLRLEEPLSSRALRLSQTVSDGNDEVFVVGAGLSDRARTGELREICGAWDFASEGLLHFSSVDGGLCDGDSGAPLLKIADGQIFIIGVLSVGNANCEGSDYFVAVSAFEPWLNEVIRE